MRKAFPIILLSLLFFSFFTPVQAQGDILPLVQCKLTGEDSCTFCDIFKMLDRIINFLLFMVIPPLAILMIAIGGGIYIIGQGKPEMLSKAKSLFTSVVIGLIMIYGAWVVVNLFLMLIGINEWTGLRTWWEIPCG